MNAEAASSDEFKAACAGPIEFLRLDDGVPVTTSFARDQRQAQLRAILADELYGEIPPRPDSINVTRQPIAGDRAERLMIEMVVAERRFCVDAALFLPPDTSRSVPLICGLDFIGPVGIMASSVFPMDPNARISSRPDFGATGNRMAETLRGTSAYRWPVNMLRDAGYAVLVSCYGSWVPDDADEWSRHGVHPLLGCTDAAPTGAISLWSWAIQRLLDVAETCDEIEMSNVSVAGHSRLGKAALWAAANDQRIAAVFANQSGCCGAAPATHPVGETKDQLAERFPHWTILGRPRSATGRPVDQNHLISLIAPRAVYLAGAKADLWSDPMGSFAALQAAAGFWDTTGEKDWVWPSMEEIWQTSGRARNGPLGFHLRPGGHDLLPYDWQGFLNFMKAA